MPADSSSIRLHHFSFSTFDLDQPTGQQRGGTIGSAMSEPQGGDHADVSLFFELD
jgi:hypothetical protein